MPTYQYSCTECGHFFEQVQSFSDDALTTCPECAGRLRKVFNAVGVVFKGSGFYRTDSRKESRTEGATPAAKATDSASSKESGAKDSSSKDSGSGSPASGSSKGASSGPGSSTSTSSTTSGSAA